MSAMMDIVEARERLGLNLEIEQLATTLGDRERMLRTHARLIIDHMALGDFAAADARIDAFEALAHELRAPWQEWWAFLFRSMRAICNGRMADADRLLAEAERRGRAAQDHQVESCCGLHRAGLLRAWERHEAMLAFDPTARRARATNRYPGTWQALSTALTFARLEDSENTRLHLDLVPPETLPPGAGPYGLYFACEPVAWAGTPEEAGRLLDQARPLAGQDIMFALTAVLWEGPAARLCALLAARLGRLDEATAHFEAAIARIERLEVQPHLARARYEYGRTLATLGGPAAAGRARVLLGRALELATKLGQTGLITLAERRLAALGTSTLPAVTTPAPAPATPAPLTLTAEGEYWTAGFEGQTFRLKDSLGVRYLARLIADPDRELHVLDLAGGRSSEDEAQPLDTGDAGELLDEDARLSYRRRLEDLREELSEAESFGDAARASRAREEIEFLGAELSRAVGLGGRSRRAGGAAERARSAVQRRIKNALERIEEHSPALASYLGRTIKTGVFCCYRPRAES
jgi:tetratricopeptide (TPR) repeat protein